MPRPSEHRTVQARILAYAQEIGWSFVSREEAEQRRAGFPTRRLRENGGQECPPSVAPGPLSLFFEGLLEAKVREFNPRYAEAAGALSGQFRHLRSDIHGNREFLERLRNRGKFYDHEERRERDLILIDYDDLRRPAAARRNVYEVTEEWAFHNGHHGTREDVVFLINGIPVLVIECKNAGKDEAIALGIDQIRRYHRETPELFVPQQLFTATDAIGFSYGATWNTVRRNIFNWKLTEHGFSNPCGENKDTDRNVRAPFYSPNSKTDRHRRNLPHWQQGEAWCFVTWRLGDSLPAGKLQQWHDEKEQWLKFHPEPWDDATEEEYHERFSQQIDEWLDQGAGSCLLRDPANAKTVADALRHFDGERYELASFVVMPNHVHVLFRPLSGHLIPEIVKSWKGFTAREINQRMGTKGALWQEEYWDRLVRSERHFLKYADYIRENPVKAKLKSGFVAWEKENGLSSPLVEGKHGLENPCSFPGRLEQKVKTFCAIPQVLAFLKDHIVFAEKDEELSKYILRQHQSGAVEATVSRALDPQRTRGLVWHTQGSGKTFTMIAAAQRLFRAPEADKPTVLLMIDRNELEDQMLKNLAALGLGNLEHASSIRRLNQLLRDDYRGIIVTMIHKFRDMPANLNTRKNIYVLIDEAHRTTGGDLGNFLMAGLPHATFIGFTGTPVDKTAFGKGTFKTFGCDDDEGYLHKYSIADSIEDGTTLPLYYQLAPNEMLVPHETLDAEFLSLAESEGVADIEELNKILERAVNLKNFLKGKERIQKVAEFVARHYRENVEPLGYKAFLVGVDREACAHYKHALDQFLPPEYSEVVYTGSSNDAALLKEFHLDPKKERQIRKSFGKLDQQPKILIVTEKLLTGFDAPVLYAMYLDKPMRDHTLLQAIARVNRPYENEAQEMVKPHGFVLDFVGIFDKLEKALAFDSDEVNAIVKDLKLLKVLFQNKMEAFYRREDFPVRLGPQDEGWKTRAPFAFNDKDVDTLIGHFRDPERRKEFFKEYKEIEMLYEIISPDAFLRPFIDDYTTLSSIYLVVRNAYARRVYVDRDFQKKTNELVQKHIGAAVSEPAAEYVVIDRSTIETIKLKEEGKATKVINLVKAIEKEAEEQSDDPFLLAMADRARAVQEAFEARQNSTEQALDELLAAIATNEARRKEQAAKGLDSFTWFMVSRFTAEGIPNPETVARNVRDAFERNPHWKTSDAELREARQQVTFAIFSEEDDLDKVTATVDALFTLLRRHDHA